MNKIEKIKKSGLCLGCGLCEAIATKEKCSMEINSKGFYEPVFKEPPNKEETNAILNCCPGINVEGDNINTVWGNIDELSEAWATDPHVRKKASSGGVITAISIYLIESNIVDGILQVGVKENSSLHNQLKVSRTREDVINNCASRYAPALVFDRLFDLLNNSTDCYAFIGKPCDIAGLKNFLNEFPEYKARFKYSIALFCAGMPSYTGTKKILDRSEYDEEPIAIKYRGDGWPGMFKATYLKKPPFKMTYNESWSTILSKYMDMRCKICADGIGMLADISVGDSWHTKDGYPDFEERDGKSFVMMRNNEGKKLFFGALKSGYIDSSNLDIDKIAEMQRYQYNRRLNVGYRLIPVQLKTKFLIKFRGLGILKMMKQASFKNGIFNMYGTFKRILK